MNIHTVVKTLEVYLEIVSKILKKYLRRKSVEGRSLNFLRHTVETNAMTN